MNRNLKLAAAVTMACGVTTGCATQTGTEADFGNSVRAMITGQTYDQYAARSPSPEALTGGDGAQLEKIVEAYRNDIAQPQSVVTPMRSGDRSTVER